MSSPLNFLLSYAGCSKANLAILANQPRESFRLIIDSGAFTVWSLGKTIILDDYCRFLDSIEFLRPFHAVQLDVIGDPKASYKNLMLMKKRGYDVMPVFTRGDTLERLEEYYSFSDYVMLGGVAYGRGNSNYVKWFVERNKGRKAHWLGFVNLPFLKTYRPESVDSSSCWGGARYGQLHLYNGFGKVVTVRKESFTKSPEVGVAAKLRRIGINEKTMSHLSQEKCWHGHLKGTDYWTKPEVGLGSFISILSHLIKSREIEKALGTKVYVAGDPVAAHNQTLFAAFASLKEKNLWD